MLGGSRPASSPEVSDDEDDTMMETGFDDFAAAPAPPVQAGFTMKQAHAQFNAAMAEVQPASAQEEQRCNLFLLE